MAQAVCARTYAVCQMEEGSLQEEYGADVDDSVNFQVYGNIAPTDKTSQAVRETSGQIMCQERKDSNCLLFFHLIRQNQHGRNLGRDVILLSEKRGMRV